MSNDLNLALSWLMEHSLMHDFEALRKQINQSFPAFTPSQFNFPNRDCLLDMATLRAISQQKVSQLEDLDDLKIIINRIKEFANTHPDFLERALKRRNLLWDFLAKLAHLRALIQLRNLLSSVQENFESDIMAEFLNETFCESYEQDQQRAKSKAEKELRKLALASKIPESEFDELIHDIAKHGFIPHYINYLLDNQLKQPTQLELFVKDPPAKFGVYEEIIQKHLDSKSKSEDLTRKPAEKKLMLALQDFSNLESKKEPKWCPLIHILDEQTQGLIGVKIKNAYED